MSFDSELLELLVCPKCRGCLTRIENPAGFACESCRLFYAIQDGLPNMLIDEAKRWPLSDSNGNSAS